MSENQYKRKGIELHDEIKIGPLHFTHHPVQELQDNMYNISGHIHPAIHLRGNGRQSITLPCFYFGSKQAYLPAFGMFTGLAIIAPQKEDKVYVIADNKVRPVS